MTTVVASLLLAHRQIQQSTAGEPTGEGGWGGNHHHPYVPLPYVLRTH